MHLKIKIWMVIATLLFLLIAMRAHLVLNGLELLFSFLVALFENPNYAFIQLDFQTTDLLISVVLILIIPVLLFLFRNRFEVLNRQTSLISLGIIIISMIFIFAPVITNYHKTFKTA